MLYKGLRKFEANTIGQDWVVGDIHGMYGYLLAELDKVGFNKETDRLFGVGDLIDRGPDSPACIRMLNEPWFFSVIGNHDSFLLSRDLVIWLNNGGTWWLDELPGGKDDLTAILMEHAYIRFEVAHKSGKKFGIVHAEFPGVDWDDFDDSNHYKIEACLWGRTKVKMAMHSNGSYNESTLAEVKNIDILFHGHSSTTEIVQHKNQVWIDTGACWDDGYFSIVKVDDYL